MSIYVHYPGQLMRTIDGGEKISLELSENNYNPVNLIIEITQMQVHRKRHDSRIPCNRDLDSNVDMRWRETVMNNFGCIPTYWKKLPQSEDFRLKRLDDCTNSEQYGNLSELLHVGINNVKYEPSCTWPIILTNDHRTTRAEANWSVFIQFDHVSEYYVEIKNSKALSFEVLWSQIGGVIGIFLGYSMLQIPEFLFKSISIIRKSIDNLKVWYFERNNSRSTSTANENTSITNLFLSRKRICRLSGTKRSIKEEILWLSNGLKEEIEARKILESKLEEIKNALT